LEQQNPNVMFTAVALQNGEGIRNYQIGMMIISTADPAAAPDDKTNLARAYQAPLLGLGVSCPGTPCLGRNSTQLF
jgi:hypothetical protein